VRFGSALLKAGLVHAMHENDSWFTFTGGEYENAYCLLAGRSNVPQNAH
jgi:hypothetical protein